MAGASEFLLKVLLPSLDFLATVTSTDVRVSELNVQQYVDFMYCKFLISYYSFTERRLERGEGGRRQGWERRGGRGGRGGSGRWKREKAIIINILSRNNILLYMYNDMFNLELH